ncbi:hypothetical protein Cme02nite_54780 [Catellatospora methionotrophica]|uniref:Uncharacterized protein n=1 Tax=Catellatospora methionotrophica TaxID=121620 RepID=A0A8J3PGU7_9ACTN|nr:hypothetical protein [Catellatospora methionotrophica]GIG17146.1 hypothetical protein Cme02nite_54780 [Catellatospora methionotrophica]
MATTPDPLLDPLAELAAQRAEFDWDGHDVLRLDDRYRRRHLPLLHESPRPPFADGDLSPGEYWPPIRSAVIPIDDAVLRADTCFTAFLDELRDAAGPCVWWPGLRLRAELVHTTLAPELDPDTRLTGDVLAPVHLIVRGPWLGRLNAGRIYLPVQATDTASARQLTAVRARLGSPPRPMLAGYLQLTGDVHGEQYAALRDLVRRYQRRVQVAVRPPDLWLMDTMDDLVLRSRVVQRLPLSAAG